MSRKFLMATVLGAVALVSAVRADDYGVLEFSTPGPDCYTDGTPVMRGEIYALVWVRDGAEFQGVLNDGTMADPENSELVIAQPNAGTRTVDGVTIGYCRPTLFHIPAAFIASHQGGRYEVTLLDTRVKESANGGLEPAGNAANVLGWCSVASVASTQVAAASTASVPKVMDSPVSGVKTLASIAALPAELSGSVSITEWTRLPDGKWRLSVEAPNGALKRGALASVTPNRSFAVRYATSVEELLKGGESGTAGYLDFDIEERSLNDSRMKIKVLTDAPKAQEPKSMFFRIVDPNSK
ncbi:MAG: hypothetical protein IJU44_01155 [Kiritimatiellae bacterium]|nr:hypothetical protein [Kiritimatiellia bacterium]